MSVNIYSRPGREQRRVVVTGMGLLSPLGLSMNQSWEAACKGQSGIARITAFDCANMETQIAGEIKGFNPDDFVAKKEQKKMDRFIHLSLAATKMAVEDSGLTLNHDNGQRVGTIVGVGIGGLPYIERQHEVLMNRGPSRVTPFFIPAVISNLAAGQISMLYGAQGPNFCITSACASGAHALGEAAKYIRDGQCDIMIAGGTESTVSPMAIAGFGAMKALSTRNDNPTAASRPWDRDRDGFVLAEGCGILILEDYEHAARRGAKVYAEITGYGVSADAYHMTSPSPGGRGAAMAMDYALKDARISPEKINYVNAHGTSTPVGDEIETEAIKRVFGDHARRLWVSSTKSMTGHTLGAAGAVESIFSILTLHHKVAPPTINLDNPSPDCDLDYVPTTARQGQIDHVLNNSFGFGGTNCSIVFSRI